MPLPDRCNDRRVVVKVCDAPRDRVESAAFTGAHDLLLTWGVELLRRNGMVEPERESQQTVDVLTELVYAYKEVVRVVNDGELLLGDEARISIEHLIGLLEFVEALSQIVLENMELGPMTPKVFDDLGHPRWLYRSV